MMPLPLVVLPGNLHTHNTSNKRDDPKKRHELRMEQLLFGSLRGISKEPLHRSLI